MFSDSAMPHWLRQQKNESNKDFQFQKIADEGKCMTHCVRILEQTLVPYTCLLGIWTPC